MKIFLETPANDWIDVPGNRREWGKFLGAIASRAPPGSIAGDRASADVIIHSSYEQLEGALIRPLSKSDIKRFVWDWGDRPTGRHSGFYCSLPRTLFDSRRHRTFIYPIAFNEFVDEFPQADTRFNFGFIGGMTASVRERIFKALKPREAHDNAIYKVQGADWVKVSDRNGSRIKNEYAEFLRATKFILCPRGYGVGTARLFETMKAGRVPVIISDRYVLPAGIDWDACSISVREDDIPRIPHLLTSWLADWPKMAARAREAWERNFSEAQLVRYMIEQLRQIQEGTLTDGIGYRIGYSARIAGSGLALRIRPVLGHVKRRLRSLAKPESRAKRNSMKSASYLASEICWRPLS
jgi:hypothetical protein